MRFLLLLISVLTPALSYCQTEYFEFDRSCYKPSTLASQKIISLDNREGSQILGFVQKGMSNKTIEVKYQGNLADSVSLFFQDVSVKNDIVLMLNEFALWEYKDQSGEYGRFKLSMRFFKKSDANHYQEFMTHDSLYVFKGIDVTKKLLRGISKTFCDLGILTQRQYNEPLQTSESYNMEELLNLDEIEKSKIPFYAIEVPKPGIYANYRELSQNSPSIPCEISIDDSDPDKLKIFRTNAKGKKVKVLNQDIYAVSDGSRFYKSLSMGFFQIVKEQNDFYYIRPQGYAVSGGMIIPIVGGGIIGGAVGGAVAGLTSNLMRKNNTPMLLYKINHRRGNGIPISRVNDQAGTN